jgi:hypothetical protein
VTETLELRPGAIAKVRLGWDGATVSGRLVVPNQLRAAVDLNLPHNTVILRERSAEPKLPADWQTMGKDKQQAWMKEWFAAPEGKAYQQTQPTLRLYMLRLAKDGSFKIENVPPGQYRLVAEMLSASVDANGQLARVANATKEVDVTKGKTIDLGDVLLQSSEKRNQAADR